MNSIQKLIPQARFPNGEMIILSKMSIKRPFHESSVPRHVAVPIMNLGYLYLSKVLNDTLAANRFIYKECDYRGEAKDHMDFPKKELTALSNLGYQDVVEPIVHFGFNSLRRVDEREAKLFLGELNKNVAARLQYLESNLFQVETGCPKHDFKERLYKHLNHLTNLRDLLIDEDIDRHYKQLDRLLTVINVKTPHVDDKRGLSEISRLLAETELNDNVTDPALYLAQDEPYKFWE